MSDPIFGAQGEAWHVGRTMRVLELLAFAPMSAPQVAAALGAQPRTVRRVLTRLLEDDYLTVREEGRRRLYEPTMRLVALAGQVVDRSRLGRVAQPHVALVRARADATTHLLAPSYMSVLCVLHAERLDDDPQAQVRELVPAHCTAGGKALLAWRERWRESVLGLPLESYTPSTTTDPDAVRTELSLVLANGYATEDGEYRDGIRAIAVPVLVGSEAVAALCCSGTDLDQSAVLPLLSRVAARIASELARP